MNTTTADAVPRSDASVQPPLKFSTTLATLVRREFWEHPVLWRAPLIIAALMVGSLLLAALTTGRHFGIHVNGWSGQLSAERQLEIFAGSSVGAMLSLFLIMMLVLTFYLLDCLYAERKDRSILFWKSLPVSDGLTVLSKFLVAVIVVPLGVLVLAVACQLLLFGVWQVGVATGRFPAVFTWNTLMWFKVQGVTLACFVLAALWYAPIAASFLLVSAWARRSPVMWATLAPLVALVVEGMFGIHYLARFLSYRTFGIWQALYSGNGADLDHGDKLSDALAGLNSAGAFTNIDLWLGVAATAAILYATVRLRRYRDDTAG